MRSADPKYNPLKYTDPSGYWFGIDDIIVGGVGFIVGFTAYAVTHHDEKGWGWKALATGVATAAIAEGCYLTLGGGLAATGTYTASAGAGAGGAGTINGAMTFSGTFALGASSNIANNYEQISKAEGWNASLLISGYSLAAGIQAGLSSPYKGNEFGAMTTSEKIDNFLGIRQYSGGKLTWYKGVVGASIGGGLNKGISETLHQAYNYYSNSWDFKNNVDWRIVAGNTAKGALLSGAGKIGGNLYVNNFGNEPLNHYKPLDYRQVVKTTMVALSYSGLFYPEFMQREIGNSGYTWLFLVDLLSLSIAY